MANAKIISMIAATNLQSRHDTLAALNGIVQAIEKDRAETKQNFAEIYKQVDDLRTEVRATIVKLNTSLAELSVIGAKLREGVPP
jgi:vacuolar-type H+-ATPase subunit D/Vma8